ncbi:exonuclease [Ureibacillus massiliensis 4400831 = CIP 108448 = CCUG 49529]|uniref:Exonuclease n=2 Tax=cellular organisms TaxID=131567 RepID=A0A0A3IZ78_9BACL|nr:exonuclease domain-containing protein [Ureibacillus massiliensis]KGR90011.1 exonuclease [Ureibacillus massiliensis 4400831 = CIP 108448 = CCUG 49529]
MAFEPFMQMLRGIQSRRSVGGIGETQNPQQIAYLRHLQKEMNQEDVMNINLNKLNVVVFDIETTGFSPEKGDCILSLGATKMSGKEIIENETFYSLVQYDKEVSKEIETLTGITTEQVKDAPPIIEVLTQFFKFTQNSTLVAHHANHERSFLQHFSNKILRTPFKQRIVDTSFLYKVVEPQIMTMTTLDNLCSHNNIPIENRHHALGDAKMTAKIWSIYIERVQQMGCETLNDVYHRFARM